MNANLSSLIAAVAGLNVIVIGEAMLDSYLEGSAGRICREAPALIVALDERRDMPGGAANTAVNVRALSGRAAFLSVVGDDPEGQLLRRCLEEREVSGEHLLVSEARRTVAKNRLLADSQMLVRFDQGSTDPIDPEAERLLIERLADLYPACDALIVSDYGYGILTPAVIRALEELQKRMPRVVVADSKKLQAYRGLHPTAVKPNYREAVLLLGQEEAAGSLQRVERIQAEGEAILKKTGARIAAVTMDVEGALVFEEGRAPYRTRSRPVRYSSAAGAGDTFVAGLALALAAGADTRAAAELASSASTVVVGKPGTSACTVHDLREYVSLGDKQIDDPVRLAARADFYRQQGRRVVFTNGCFDLLHGGHINYLHRANALGDVLVVGVNSDESVRRLKGPTRPINCLKDRLKVLAALSCVDHLISFEDDTPHNLIRAARPDIFVKGGDYTRETLPEVGLVEELGGVVHILPYLENHSTTGIIERIQSAGGRLAEPACPALGVNTSTSALGPSPQASRARAPAAGAGDPAADWSEARNLLCVRLDSLGDVLMTTPASGP
jgi:D-beta-D-heptose 7-phosphate kinase/D-beta-D-heptose 1-phosphate adenosyltransferase